MNTLLLRLWQRTLRRLDIYRWGALGLLLLSVLLGLWATNLQREGAALRANLGRTRSGFAALPPVVRQIPLGNQVDDFVETLPPLMQVSADLEYVFMSARQHNIQLLKGDYKYRHELNDPLASYTATFPVHADYAAIRDFSADILGTLPNAALDDLRMARDSADASQLESEIRLTFFYRR